MFASVCRTNKDIESKIYVSLQTLRILIVYKLVTIVTSLLPSIYKFLIKFFVFSFKYILGLTGFDSGQKRYASMSGVDRTARYPWRSKHNWRK